MEYVFMHVWIFPFMFMAYYATKDRIGFLALMTWALITWAIMLAMYLEQVK